jgi:hypothetical protein
MALEQAHKLIHQGQLVLRGSAYAQVLKGNACQTRQVPGQQARGFVSRVNQVDWRSTRLSSDSFLWIKAVGGVQGLLQVAQLLFQALGEELLVEAGEWGLVGHCPEAPRLNGFPRYLSDSGLRPMSGEFR